MSTSGSEIAQYRRARLQAWMDERGLKQADLAERLGVGRAYASLLLNPKRHFGEKAARTIERRLLMPDGYLDMPAGETAGVSAWADARAMDADAYALVPRVMLALADGQPVGVPQNLPALALPAATLVARGVTLRVHLRLVLMPDRSMEGGIEAGDLVLIDLGQAAIEDGQVYAVQHGERIIIRRLFRRSDGRALLHPDNAAFPAEEVRPGEGCVILGRKVWRGG